MYGCQDGREWEELGDWAGHIDTIDTIYEMDPDENLLQGTRSSASRTAGTWMGRKSRREGDTCRHGPSILAYGSNGTPLQYSCLENPMDGGAWWAAVHGVAKSRTWLSDFTFTFHFLHALEKEMATHSSVLSWRIPGAGELDGLPSMGSHRVRHDWSDLAAVAAAEITQHRKATILQSN